MAAFIFLFHSGRLHDAGGGESEIERRASADLSNKFPGREKPACQGAFPTTALSAKRTC
jgi:hypothetical protein